MQHFSHFDLPDLPTPIVLAFDDAVQIKGYTDYQLVVYAADAVEQDRRRRNTWVARLVCWMGFGK